jgi:hypothetical protein
MSSLHRAGLMTPGNRRPTCGVRDMNQFGFQKEGNRVMHTASKLWDKGKCMYYKDGGRRFRFPPSGG